MGAHAQMHHVDKPERVTRAVGVYEWTGDLIKPTASRFVPVSLFINGQFEDAGLYLARPVPFALQSGDVYAVERAGEPNGLLDLETASRVVSGGAPADGDLLGAWYGFGKFTPQAPPKPAPKLHPSAHLPVIQGSSDASHPQPGTKAADTPAGTKTDSDRPHMNRRNGGDSADESADKDKQNDHNTASGAGNSAGSGGGSGTTASSDSTDDTDRPTLRRRDPAQDAARKKPVGGRNKEASVTAAGPQPGDDPDRPTLSRHAEGAEGPKELTGLPADMHQAVAVSDPVTREAHPFAREWESPAERATTLSEMAALARTQVTAYLSANHLVPSDAGLRAEQAEGTTTDQHAAQPADTAAPAGGPRLQRGKPKEYAGGSGAEVGAAVHAPAATTSKIKAVRGSRTPPKAPPALRLQDEQIAGYMLSYGGLPTFVYTARVASALAQTGNLPTAAANPTVFVTVVAQRLASGELQPALDAVTDSAHLDRGPRLRLVDAVDPDASHRASLLFELRAASSRQFALYRLTSARADQTFTTASIQ